MKIKNCSVLMSSSHSSMKTYAREESLIVWHDTGREESKIQGLNVELSGQAKELLAQQKGLTEAGPAKDQTLFTLRHEDQIKILLLESFMKNLTGKKLRFFQFKKITTKSDGVNLTSLRKEAPESVRQGWGLLYNYHESYSEKEKLSFFASGVIKTGDCREISFSVRLNMSREFAFQHHITIRNGDAAVDPLVINFDGKNLELTETKFAFDLDTDGKQEFIPFVRPGSGFLALDINGDGLINNGKELFGPSTGNGFTELTIHDLDDNHWIDENDPIYERLRIWTKDSKGNDVLMALGQKGIGAIYLGNIVTPFDLKDSANNLLGIIRNTGIYVHNNGSAGTIHQIDLVV